MSTTQLDLEQLHQSQRAFFQSGRTLDWRWRRERLRQLRTVIGQRADDIVAALYADLHKSEFEAYSTEILMVVTELKHQLRMLRRMSRPQRVPRSLFTIFSRGRVLYEPYGQTLIVSPWNYPFHLSMLPLVDAVATGNVVVLKLSPDTPNTNAVVRSIVEAVFEPAYVAVVEGHREVNQALFALKWNHIFLTGSPDLGRVAMAAAARWLTPVTLELGGKSPCIVDSDADLKMAARRIVFGKLTNAGQTCVAPDYLMVHRSVKEPLIEEIKRSIKEMYEEADGTMAEHYPHIVSEKAFERLTSYLGDGDIRCGGTADAAQRLITPTVIDHVAPDSELLTREIFGPILPVVEFGDIGEVVAYLQEREKPLALYYFTASRRRARYLLQRTSSGGACVNDTLMHVASSNLPFGGVQNSGIGHYHGRYSYEAFSHRKAVLVSGRLDLAFKFPPFGAFWTRMLKRMSR